MKKIFINNIRCRLHKYIYREEYDFHCMEVKQICMSDYKTPKKKLRSVQCAWNLSIYTMCPIRTAAFTFINI